MNCLGAVSAMRMQRCVVMAAMVISIASDVSSWYSACCLCSPSFLHCCCEDNSGTDCLTAIVHIASNTAVLTVALHVVILYHVDNNCVLVLHL